MPLRQRKEIQTLPRECVNGQLNISVVKADDEF